jgi:hypothetical protein
MFVFVCLCCVVLCRGWSLAQMSPTKCLNTIMKPPVWGGQGPYKYCRATDDEIVVGASARRSWMRQNKFDKPSTNISYARRQKLWGFVRTAMCTKYEWITDWAQASQRVADPNETENGKPASYSQTVTTYWIRWRKFVRRNWGFINKCSMWSVYNVFTPG